MSCSLEYRELAAQQRSAAQSTQLPMVRMRHLDAADRWDFLADQIERYQQPAGSMARQEYFY